MIEDVFEVLDHNNDPDDTIVRLHCKKCDNNFTAEFNIVGPINCTHKLGKSITVVCPYCLSTSTTTSKEGKAKALQNRLEELNKKIENYMTSNKVIFNVIGDPDVVSYKIPMRCSACNHEFTIGMLDGTNCKVDLNLNYDDSKLIIECPGCHKTEQISHTQATERLAIMTSILELKALEKELNEDDKGTSKI